VLPWVTLLACVVVVAVAHAVARLPLH